MTKIERIADRLALQSGSTTIVLDKKAGEAVLQRKLLFFWARKPVTRSLNSIRRVTIDTSVDPASEAESCRVMLLMREGGGRMLSAEDKQDAAATVATVRTFLGISE